MSSFSDQLGYCSLVRFHVWETAPWEKAKANVKLCFLIFEKHSPVIALCLKTVISYILFRNMAILNERLNPVILLRIEAQFCAFVLTNDVGSF